MNIDKETLLGYEDSGLTLRKIAEKHDISFESVRIEYIKQLGRPKKKPFKFTKVRCRKCKRDLGITKKRNKSKNDFVYSSLICGYCKEENTAKRRKYDYDDISLMLKHKISRKKIARKYNVSTRKLAIIVYRIKKSKKRIDRR